MSETEHRRGTIREITGYDNLADFCTGLMTLEEIDPFYDTALEYLESGEHEKWLVVGDKVYEILESKSYPEDDEIIEAVKNKDGTINYEVRWYNGGASFSEVLGQAFNKLKKEN